MFFADMLSADTLFVYMLFANMLTSDFYFLLNDFQEILRGFHSVIS